MIRLCEAIILADRKIHCVINADTNLVAKARHYKRRLAKLQNRNIRDKERVLNDLGVSKFTMYNDMPFWCFDQEQHYLFFTPRGIPLATPFLEKEASDVIKHYTKIITVIQQNYQTETLAVLDNQTVVMLLQNFDEASVDQVFDAIRNNRLRPYIESANGLSSHLVDIAITLILLSSLIAGLVIANHEIGKIYRELNAGH